MLTSFYANYVLQKYIQMFISLQFFVCLQ